MTDREEEAAREIAELRERLEYAVETEREACALRLESMAKTFALGVPVCSASVVLQEGARAIRSRADAPAKPPSASASCPVCGIEVPHAHRLEDIDAWVNARLAAFGFRADVHSVEFYEREKRARLAPAWERGYRDCLGDASRTRRHPASNGTVNPYLQVSDATAKSPCPGCRCCEYDPAYHGTGQELPIPEDPIVTAALDTVAVVRAELERSRAIVTAARKFAPLASHTFSCSLTQNHESKCDCGLRELVAAVEAKP